MKKETFSNTLFSKSPEPLKCGCVVGYFDCAELQRIDSLKKDAYYRSDWKEYEKYRKQSWAHIKLECPQF